MNRRIFIFSGIAVFVVVLLMLMPKGDKKQPAAAKQITSPAAKELYQKAVALKKEGQLAEARDAYREIVRNHPDTENIDAVQKELETVSMNMLFSTALVEGKTVMHEVVSGDTLGKIAKKYGTTVEFIQRSNNLKNDIIRIGQKLRVWTGQFNIYVDKSQNILMVKDGNDVIKIYRVSTGKNNSTPVGEYTITTRLTDPVWFTQGAIVPPESPQNVLGTRWLGFDLPGYGIHGTVEPETIGQQVTAGCVRMRNEDVEELYSIIPMGTKVVIVD